ncbi:MAG: hypothetical protein JSU00_24115 [Acidobacteria bacterium]|nr:hypothetical protein [Acidobacteriota bacterium]
MSIRNLACLIALPAWAQFSGLAVTDDGTQVYFSAPLVLTADSRTGLNSELRLYRWTANGVEFVAERGSLAAPGVSSANAGVTGARVSGDGSLYGYTMYNVCASPVQNGVCDNVLPYQAVLQGRISAPLGAGQLHLSRNGRWALLNQTVTWNYRVGPPVLFDTQAASVSYPPGIIIGTQSVSSGGMVLTSSGIWEASTGTALPYGLETPFLPLAISDDGSSYVYRANLYDSAGKYTGYGLGAHSIATGADIRLFTPAAGSSQLPQFMGVSNDGVKVLYRVTDSGTEGPAFLADARSGISAPIPLADGELATDGAMNGPGDIVALATSFHRIVMLRYASGAVADSRTIVPVTAWATVPSLAPGSIARIAAPVPPGVEGRILVAGAVAPMVAATGRQFIFQVPWEQPAGAATVTFDYATQSPFRQTQRTNVYPLFPGFEKADPGFSQPLGIKMILADFSGLVIAQPAPGQIVHMYMTGLGRVQGSVETGTAAPLDSLRPGVNALECRFSPLKTPAQTLFAGLAPGMIGLYQVTFRFPDETASGPLNGLSCTVKGPDGGTTFGFTGSTLP